jgi:tetratricopeptide (TPR) repeat protein
MTQEKPPSDSEQPQQEILQRQTQAMERLADQFAPTTVEEEERRAARLARAFGRVGTRMALLIGLFVGGFEAFQWLYESWEMRSAAQDYAAVGSEIFYKENNPQVAESLLADAVSLNPNNSRYRFLQAYIDGMGSVRTLLNLDRPHTKAELDEAHEALGNALFLERQSPDKPESQILRGQIYAALSDFERARDSLTDAINKGNALRTQERGWLSASLYASSNFIGDLVGISGLGQTVATTLNLDGDEEDLDSHLSFAYVRLALVEKEIGTSETAKAHLEKALEYDPSSKWAYLWFGVFQSEQRNWEQARDYYDRALALDPRFDLAYYNKGWTYLHARPKDYVTAGRMFQKAIDIKPDYKEAFYGLGMVYGYQNKYQVAHRYLSKAVTIDDKYLTGWKWRAIVNDELGDTDAALADFSTAITLNPSNDDLYVRRARVLTKRKEYEAALQDLLLAKDFNASNYRIPYYTGQVYVELAQFDSAVSALTEALELRKEYSEAYVARAGAYLGLGSVSEARKDYDLAVQFASYRPERMLNKRAGFFLSQGDFELAIEDYQLAREKNPRFAPAWLGESRAAIKIGDNPTALYAVTEYLKLKPQSEEAESIRKELAGE